jgi:hypothetical protein
MLINKKNKTFALFIIIFEKKCKSLVFNLKKGHLSGHFELIFFRII